MSTATYLAAIIVGGSIVAAVIVVLGSLAGAAMMLRTTERLARGGHLNEHGVRVLTHLADGLNGVLRVVLDTVRRWTSRRK